MVSGQIVIYDLDGTITRLDSLYFFILFLLKKRELKLKKILPALFRHFLIHKDPLRLKISLLQSLKEKRRYALEDLGRGFALSLNKIFFRKKLFDLIKIKKREGAKLIILTSALDIYANPIGERLGFYKVLSTKVGFKNSIINGCIEGVEIRNLYKVLALKKLAKEENIDLARAVGYGNQDDEGWLNLLVQKIIY